MPEDALQAKKGYLNPDLLKEVEGLISKGYLRKVSAFYQNPGKNKVFNEPVRSQEVAKLIRDNDPDRYLCIVVTLQSGKGVTLFINGNEIEGTEERESHEEYYSPDVRRFLEGCLHFDSHD